MKSASSSFLLTTANVIYLERDTVRSMRSRGNATLPWEGM